MVGCKRTKKRREWETEKRNIRNVLEKLNGLGLQTNSLIPFFLESSSDEDEGKGSYI